MQRRRVLGLAGGALAGATAGCLSVFRGEPEDPGCEDSLPYEEEGPPEPPETGATLSLTTRALETAAPTEGDVDVGLVTAGHVRRHVAPGEPGRIELAVVNGEPDPREFDMGPTPPFSTYRGGHDETDAGLYVVPTDRALVSVMERRTDDCAAIRDPEARVEIEPVELEPCAVYAREYDVFADAEGEGCFEPGEYRFRGRWTEHQGTLRDEEIVWEFTLYVEEVGSDREAATVERPRRRLPDDLSSSSRNGPT